MIVNWLLRLFGWTLCLVAIVLGPIAKRFNNGRSVHRPWIDGLVTNCWRAYRKYDLRSWIRRMIGIYHNPKVALHYLKVLSNKEDAAMDRLCCVRRVSDLTFSHDVKVDHKHHRDRVEALKAGQEVTSKFGPVIVVGDVVHDGNHRLAAYKEAGREWIEVVQWSKVGSNYTPVRKVYKRERKRQLGGRRL